jgi:hypothetical protein
MSLPVRGHVYDWYGAVFAPPPVRPGPADGVDSIGRDEEGEEAEPHEDRVAVGPLLVIQLFLYDELATSVGVLK